MPLGLARSVLAKTAAAGGGAVPELYTFRDDEAQGSADKATYVISHTGGPFANNITFSYVAWFRVNGTGSSGGMLAQIYKGTSPNNNNGSNLQFNTTSMLQYNLYNNVKNVVLRSNKAAGPYPDQASFEAGVLDGEWHCVMVAGHLNDASQRYMYIDNVDVLNDLNPGNLSGTGLNMDQFTHFPLRMNTQLNNTTYVANREFGAEADVGPIWYYDTIIDFSDSAVRAHYYNASNTDGFVDGGTDGTAGGAATPKLYFYTNASGGQIYTNGTGGTVNTSVKGSETITIYQEGAGTGDTY